MWKTAKHFSVKNYISLINKQIFFAGQIEYRKLIQATKRLENTGEKRGDNRTD